MAVYADEKQRTFTLQTKNTTYQMKVDAYGMLLHTYYGEKTDNSDLSYRIPPDDRGFSGYAYEASCADDRLSSDLAPQEYSCFGTGDYRISALRVRNENGSQAVTLCYAGYELSRGKYSIPGLPAVYADETEAETLGILLRDPESGLEVLLQYGVLEELDIITRAVKVVNRTMGKVVLLKAASMCLDWLSGDYEWLTFYGKHAMERTLQRTPIAHGISAIGSVRGASSHHYNPFAVVCEKDTNETKGLCYGVSFVYSGEFLMETEKDQIDQTRLICGIHPDDFAWTLEPGESFDTPEVILSCSSEGFGKLSHNFHQVIREHICRGEWKNKRRPVLINNWEGTYFDFTGDKLVSIAKDAAELGVELFVMDDGWFGKRDDDRSGLGDWFPNEKKLGCSLKELGDRIVGLGMKFGIWFEPEMISEDSDLYRAHPDWAIRIPERSPMRGRYQLVLDMTNPEVQEYLFRVMSEVLHSADISYVKWDMNRSISDWYTQTLPADRQGEMSHRYVLGLYALLERLTAAFPEVLFEGCSGGGGRFDAGMLYYCPQIWCSDDTDARERTKIQYGTSFFYPVSAVGSHVSTVPNHQTGRITPFETRAVTAMAGSFGYELDLNLLPDAEKQAVTEQIQQFKAYGPLIHNGRYYRLTNPMTDAEAIWAFAAQDGSEILVQGMIFHAEANTLRHQVKLRGLCAEKQYRLDGTEQVYTGAALMAGGVLLPKAWGDYTPVSMHFTEV